MADTETKETKIASTPEKKVVEEEKTKEVTKDTPTKEAVKESKEAARES